MNRSPKELDAFALQLKALFATLYKTSQKPAILRFRKVRVDGRVTEIVLDLPGDWPAPSFEQINSALLALHHAGLIMYGANSIRLNEALVADAASTPGADRDTAV